MQDVLLPPQSQSLSPASVLSRRQYDEAIAAHLREAGPALNKLDLRIGRLPKDSEEAGRLRTMRVILRSGLFDSDFYLRANPTLRAAGIDPLEHYVRHGEAEGTVPNTVFQPHYYRRFAMRGVPAHRNALQHYIESGESARASASKLFNASAYLSANPPLGEFVDRPLFHYLKVGQPAKLRLRRRPQAQSSSSIRVAAHLGVKDEVEIIEHTIAHLRRIGVDIILVCDLASTDGTAEILEKYRSDDFLVLQMGDRSFDDAYVDEQNLEFIKKAQADWVLFLDADEYWIPATGNVKDCVWLAEADALTVPRFNIPCDRSGPIMPAELIPENYEQLLLIAEGIPDFARHMKDNPDTPWIVGQIEPKIMARPGRISHFTDGWHDMAEDEGPPLLWVEPDDLFIAHLPLTTRRRFDQKIEDYRAHFLSNPDETDYTLRGEGMWQSSGWQWRRWIKLSDEGLLDEEFNRNRFNDEELAALQQRGMICSATELLRRRTVRMP